MSLTGSRFCERRLRVITGETPEYVSRDLKCSSSSTRTGIPSSSRARPASWVFVTMPSIFNAALPFVLPSARTVALLRWLTDPPRIAVALATKGRPSADLARHRMDAVASAREPRDLGYTYPPCFDCTQHRLPRVLECAQHIWRCECASPTTEMLDRRITATHT
jgi:hypothetical protein